MPRKFNNHPHAVDMTGMVVGRLTVLRMHPKRGGTTGRLIQWECRCECGAVIVRTGNTLRFRTRSCGCLMKDSIAQVNFSHGDTGSSEYAAWARMKSRCYYEKDVRYEHYGGRGVTVCKRWLHSYESFLADMGRKPSKQHSLDRINNDANYSPSNCRWATRSQ